AGNYKTNWDAGSFASGVYLYRIQAGSYIESKKMILLR
ncbi:MAG: peptidase S8, partial [Aliifodinibius sp.]|nr:peptidase S8 [Fodinibius sp.]NIV13236.1 peptidase S8 [Fodinibius sp.]NIY26897.1 peptidase S8 [Fodinibius sp.]